MKLTKKQLQEIIATEINKINEASSSHSLAASISNAIYNAFINGYAAGKNACDQPYSSRVDYDAAKGQYYASSVYQYAKEIENSVLKDY